MQNFFGGFLKSRNKSDPEFIQKKSKKHRRRPLKSLVHSDMARPEAATSACADVLPAIERRTSNSGTQPAASSYVNTAEPVAQDHSNSGTLDKRVTVPYVDASVQDNSKGTTNIVIGNNNVFQHGPSLTRNTDTVLSARIENLRRSRNAEYNMTANSNRGPCTPKTRTAVLKSIMDWCKWGSENLYWMSGMAGTGKTTIAFSASQMLDEASLLAATFFCSRSLPDCRDIKFVIPTIAVQLARRYSPFKASLEIALDKDPDILQRGLNDQFYKLIIEPWEADKAVLPGRAIVIVDALDECDEGHGTFLQVLFNNSAKLPFKILITSRPEVSILDVMKENDQSLLSTLVLHEVEDHIVQADIVKYLTSQLSHRTTVEVIEQISNLAGSLFLYAAILARLFVSGKANILARLEILQDTRSTPDKFKMLAPLDELYKGVLGIILSADLLDIEKQEIKDVLDTIICAREPLTRRAIAELLMVEEKEINRPLDILRSIISIPTDYRRPITILHASLPDFLLDSSRSGEFCCKHLEVNMLLTKRCLALMDSKLRPNLCQVHTWMSNELVPSNLVKNNIAPGLRYAVIHLSEHWMLSSCSDHQAISGLIRPFLTKHLLSWVECLSLLGKLAVSVYSLQVMLNALSEDEELAPLVHTALRLIYSMYGFLQDNAVEMHRSALAWIPIRSVSCLQVHYPKTFDRVPSVLCGIPADWTEPEQIINLNARFHTNYGTSTIAISKDGNRIALACDSNIHIWNTRHQVKECVLEDQTHSGLISFVAITGDGNRVLSVSHIQAPRIWNVATRQIAFTLNVSSPALAIATSPNGKCYASGHKDNLIRIWDATNGNLVQSLEGHQDSVTTVSFVPHTPRLLVSGSNDQSACVWNLHTGKAEKILCGHTGQIWFVTASPDGNKIMTSSEDTTTRLWDGSGIELQILQGHSDWVHCAAFLPDGKRVVTGSQDGTLRVWDVATGNIVHAFTEAGPVRSIAVFPDGVRIASCSGGRISIWNMREGVLIDRRNKITEDSVPGIRAKSMVFSSNGKRVLLIPSLQILDTETLKEQAVLRPHPDASYRRWALSALGRKVAAVGRLVIDIWQPSNSVLMESHLTLQGHLSKITSVSFSHDECQLVSTSTDCTARIWDVTTGNQIHVLRHEGEVRQATFSHHSVRIVSSVQFPSSRFMVHVWDGNSGGHLHMFESWTESVRFTPDDQHIVASSDVLNDTVVFNAQTCELEHMYDGYDYWTVLDDGSSCALRPDGWVYRFSSFDRQPHKLLWIPSAYRPYIYGAEHINSSKRFPVYGPLFTSYSQGIRVCLPRADGLVTLVIPSSYNTTIFRSL